ncbi:Rz1 family lipoprotein [Escherichia coli]|nr:Rz1 family lipoprotein [Escherichia coli]
MEKAQDLQQMLNSIITVSEWNRQDNRAG